MGDFDSLTEEDLQMLMELGVIPDQIDSLDSQIEQAQSIRNRQGPQGTHTGRVYVAASPLEHVAHAWQGIRAGKDLERLRAEQQKLLAQQVRGRSKFFNRLTDTPERRANASFIQDVGVDEDLVRYG